MPGTLLRDDWQKSVTDELTNHARNLGQAFQVIGDTAAQPAPAPAGPDPQQVLAELQQHAQNVSSTVQQAPSGIVQFGQQQAGQVQQELQDFASGLVKFNQAQPPTSAPGSQPLAGGGTLQDYARQQAEKYGLDPEVFARQIQQESGFNPTAKSPAGATGIAQFMPATAQGMGVDPNDPYASLEGAARLMGNYLNQYQGDYGKALAAYNTGPGNVDKFGGVPPFEETQRYVETSATSILGTRDTGPYQPNVQESLERVGQGIAPRDISQFGDRQLTNSEAYSACGPAAAVRFAQRFGRNPSLREAVDLSKELGWTEGQGMAGLQSEKALMDRLGVATKVVGGPQWDAFAREARSGNPVTISTSGRNGGHYFFADGYDPQSGAFHVGRSGTDLVGGKEWMTGAEMEARMGAAQGALFADNPTVPTKSVAGSSSNGGAAPIGTARERQPQPLQIIGNAVESGRQAVTQVVGDLQIASSGESRALTPAMQPTPSDALTNPPVQQAPSTPPVMPSNLPPAQETLSQSPLARAFTAPDTSLTAAMQPTPSDQLTSPTLRTGGAAQPPPSMPPPLAGPAILPSLGEARDAIVRGDNQAALDALGRAGEAASTTDLLQPHFPQVGQALAESPVGQAYQSDIRKQLLPNISEPNHPFNVMADLEAKYGTSVPNEQMTPEDQQRARDAQLFIGGMSGPVGPQGAGHVARAVEGEVERLRLDKFPDWARSTIEDAARATDFGAEARRGVIPDAQAEAMADQLGLGVDDWIAKAQPGQLFNTEETRALRNVVTSQAAKVNDLAAQVSDAASRGEVTDRLIAQAAAEGDKLQSLITVMEGNRAEWGRAGRAWQNATRLIDLPPGEAISQIYKQLGGRDKALEAVQQYNELVQSGASPLQMANFWAGIKNAPADVGDWLKALRYNSMLSGPRTVEVNTISNALEIPWRLARDAGASVARGRPEEIAPELSGLLAGLSKGNRAFMEAWTHGLTAEQAAAGELPSTLASRVKNPVGKTIARAIDIPSRVLAAGDAWGSALAQSMALGRRAGVMASAEGLRGPAWHARVAELMADPSASMLKEAHAIAERMVYHGDMGNLGDALAQLQRVPFLGNVILPFLRTVYHITARGVDRSPLGLAGTGIDVLKGKYGPLADIAAQLGRPTPAAGAEKGLVPLGERLGDNLMGSAITYAFYRQAQDGNITGAGPDDREKRDMLRAQGWQPYSVKVGDHYVSYANWGPAAIPLAGAAAAAEAQKYPKPGAAWHDMLADAGTRTAKLVTEQSYLQGIGAIWKAIDDPERYGGQSLGQFITSLVPYGSALNTLGQATDPLMRQPTRSSQGLGPYLGESVEARLPGARENVPVARDQLGRPIPNEAAGAGALNPLRTTTIRSNAVLSELLDKGADIGEPQTAVRNVDLTPTEQRTVNAAAGTYIERNVQAVMNDSDYQRADPLSQQRALQRAIESGRTQAGGELLQSLSDTEIKRRLEESRRKRVPVPIESP